VKGARRRKFKNDLKFERAKSDTIFRHNEAKNLAERNTKDTVNGIEENFILVTSKKDGMKIIKVLLLYLGMSSEIF